MQILRGKNSMARKISGPKVDRRKFLTGIAVAGAAASVAPAVAAAAPTAREAAPRRPSALPPSARIAALETATPGATPEQVAGIPGSDFMIDVIRSMKIDYITSNPASSFRGLHESIINYGKNKGPEFLTVTHEEIGVAMAHGYFKTTGKPMATLCHGTVGLQHAAMAVYNAWCDRVPVIVIGGNDADAAQSAAWRADRSCSAGHQRHRPRLHEVGRQPRVAAAFRGVVRSCLQDRDDAAL